jgi:hypothetical protein
LTASTTRNIIQIDLRTHDAGGRHQIGTLAGFGSEQVAGFILECMAGFVGIRTLDHVERSIGDLKAPVAKGTDDVIATIESWRKSAGAPPAVLAPPANGTSLLEGIETATKPIQEMMDLVTGNSATAWVTQRLESVLDEIVRFDGPNPFAEASEAAVKFIEGVLSDEASELLLTLKNIWADLDRLFGGKIPSPRDLSPEILRSALIAVSADALEGMLRGIRDLVLRLLDLARDMLKAIRDLLLVKIRLPFIEDLVKLVTGGAVSVDTSFSLAGAMLLLGAIPATLTHKLATGKAPFAKGESISLPYGLVTVQSGAEGAALASAILDTIVTSAKVGINSFQSVKALQQSKIGVVPGLALAGIMQSLSAINETVALSLRPSQSPEEVGAGWTGSSLMWAAAIKTTIVGCIAFKKNESADGLDNFSRAWDITTFAAHFVCKTVDAATHQDVFGGIEEPEDKIALTGIVSAKWVDDERVKAVVLGVSMVSRVTALVTSIVRLVKVSNPVLA